MKTIFYKEYLLISKNFVSLESEAILSDNGGKNIKIALLDSGINLDKKFFKNASIEMRNFIEEESPYDKTGHGTKNASLLLDILPHCKLFVAKVLAERTRHGKDAESIAKAIRWAIYKKVDIVLMPFGTSKSSREIAKAIKMGQNKQIQFFASAGNRGENTILFPAFLKGVFAVSAIDKAGIPMKECCQLSMVDIYASGENISTPLCMYGTDSISGSSPACVIAGGIEALRLSYEKKLLHSQRI